MTEPQEPGEPSSREPVRVGADTTAVCPGCGAVNQRAARFCTACGQSTVAAADTRPMRVGAFDLTRTVADSPRLDVVAPEAPAPIPPGRVIDVGPAPGHPSVRCSRCSSVCSGDAQFCRFCGQALAAASTPNAATITPTPSSYGARAVEGGAPILRARLVLITRDGSEGRAYLLGASTDLGRSEGGILFPDDQFVSPRHARIVARGSAFVLRDLESTNGVYVRIPFARTGENAESRASVAGEGKRDKPEQTEKMGDKTTIRGHHHSEALSSLREAAAEQPLTDQELFLVGQQVLRFEVVRQAEEAFGGASENGTLLFGTPTAPRFARITQRTVEGVARDVFHVRRAETVIGRESGDIVFTDDPFLSRRHAVLHMHGTGAQKKRFTLSDLGSSNGTFLRIQNEVQLRYGDQFRIGQQLLRFDIDSDHGGA